MYIEPLSGAGHPQSLYMWDLEDNVWSALGGYASASKSSEPSSGFCLQIVHHVLIFLWWVLYFYLFNFGLFQIRVTGSLDLLACLPPFCLLPHHLPLLAPLHPHLLLFLHQWL